MTNILSTYLINKNTLALFPARAMNYDTLILEKGKKIKVQKTPMQLIEKACIKKGWVTYEGRRQAVMQNTGFVQKVPIPINIAKGIYFFPTHSPRTFENIWLAYHNIPPFNGVQQDPSHPKQTIIQFIDGQTIKLNVSLHIIEQQMKRTLQCIGQIGGVKNIYHREV